MTEKMSQKSNITSLKLQEPFIVVYDRMKNRRMMILNGHGMKKKVPYEKSIS